MLVQLACDDVRDGIFTTEPYTSDDVVLKSYFWDHNPYHEQVASWQETVQLSFSDCTFLKKLFVERTNILAECNEEELALIKQRWGDQIFHDVWGHGVIHPTLGIA